MHANNHNVPARAYSKSCRQTGRHAVCPQCPGRECGPERLQTKALPESGPGSLGHRLISYVIGWPLITLLGILAVYYEQPALVLLGGPMAYGLSHLVFLLGMYLAGARYSWIFLRWLTRVAMLKLFKRYPDAVPPVQ